jgi:hypothetical protein
MVIVFLTMHFYTVMGLDRGSGTRQSRSRWTPIRTCFHEGTMPKNWPSQSAHCLGHETAYVLVCNDISEMANRDIEEVSRHSWQIERHGRVVWSENGRMLAVTRLLMDEETWRVI